MQALGAPIAELVLLVLLKTMVDLAAHLAERRRLGRGRRVALET